MKTFADFQKTAERRIAEYHAASPEIRNLMDNSAKTMYFSITGQEWTAPESAWCGVWNAMIEFVREKTMQ